MELAAGGDFEGVIEQEKDGGQALGSAAPAAGKVDDQSARCGQAGEAAREPGVGVALCAQGAHGFGQAGGFAVEEAAGGLGSAIAGAKSGAADGEDESGTLGGERCELRSDQSLLVGYQGGEELGERPLLPEKRGDGGAGGVLGEALGAAVGDGENGEEHLRGL